MTPQATLPGNAPLEHRLPAWTSSQKRWVYPRKIPVLYLARPGPHTSLIDTISIPITPPSRQMRCFSLVIFPRERVSLIRQASYILTLSHQMAACSFDIIFMYHAGGYICLAQTLLHILFNHVNTNSTTPDLEYATDILVTEQSLTLGTLQEDIIPCDQFSASKFETLNGRPLNANSWLNNSIEYKRGGKTSRYSQRVRLNCTNFISEYYLKDLGVLPWKPKDYLILSNGNCGSSCALFANRMHQLKKVKTIAVGGIHCDQMTYQSFPGLQVSPSALRSNFLQSLSIFSHSNIIPQPDTNQFLHFPDYNTEILPYMNTTDYGNLNEKYPALFKNIISLPQRTAFRFTFREGYFPDKADTPLEYQFIPADERIDFDPETARNIYSLWFKVAGHFNIPLLAHFGKPLHERAKVKMTSYYAQECAVAAPVPMMPSEVSQLLEVSSAHTQDPRSQLVKAGHADVPHRFNAASNYALITSDDMFLFGYLSKGKGVHYKTGIIHIGTFLPADAGDSVQTLLQD
ncbi:hypothetical protein BC938DRAFT_478581 [Jimgerdemannia flammicorona]|uniref:Uncharacterized protein n=1 Tax=Jimgerdemannia flammicorona TaxID=994334 RepID=A0A433QML8_9FUNG|nr:hypothetical protein BC938DRAFT_478581 [Jimgerdemannia flammicorona]